jgi:Ca-activated chloride channel family protein
MFFDHFANSEYLLLLLLLPLLLYRYRRENRQVKASIRFSDLRGLGRLQGTLWNRLRHVLFLFKMLGLACLIVGLARPQAGRETRQTTADGIDIVLTLDVSGSMSLQDLADGEKDRLQVAKEVVASFIQGRHSDRLGMVVFAGESFTQCPLTLDYDILLGFLDDIKLAEKDWDGTAIGLALITASNRLRESPAKSKVIILLTDGVNTIKEIDPLTAADVAAAVGIRVYTIGVGTDGVIRQPVQGVFGTRYQTIEVEIDEETLEEVARRTGAKYYRATSAEKLEEIYREIGALETTKIETQIHIDYAERYAYFLWPGLIFLLSEIFLANTRFRRIP